MIEERSLVVQAPGESKIGRPYRGTWEEGGGGGGGGVAEYPQ